MGQFGDMLNQQAGGIIGQAAGAGLGLLFEHHEDQRQLNQQRRLQEMQLQGSEDLSKFNSDQQYNQQMKLWDATNYKAQMGQLTKAGLNPALVYGTGGGAGGSTTPISGGGSVGSGQAATGAQGQQAMQQSMMMEAQLGLMRAQTSNTDADTQKKKAETPTTGNIADTNIENTQASTGNIKADTALKEINTQIAKIQEQYTSEGMRATIDKTQAELLQIENENWINSPQVMQAKQDTIVQNLANTILTGESIKAGIEVDKAQVNKMAQDIAQGWRNIDINTFRAQIEANFKGIGQIAGNLLEQVFKAIDDTTGKKNDQQPIKIVK